MYIYTKQKKKAKQTREKTKTMKFLPIPIQISNFCVSNTLTDLNNNNHSYALHAWNNTITTRIENTNKLEFGICSNPITNTHSHTHIHKWFDSTRLVQRNKTATETEFSVNWSFPCIFPLNTRVRVWACVCERARCLFHFF